MFHKEEQTAEIQLLTLDPVAADWTEEVGIQAVGFFYLVQQLPDVHHLQTSVQNVKFVIRRHRFHKVNTQF